MPIINRYYIQRYKEVILPESAGTIYDGGLSTYNLDDPSVTPNGTGDFLGVIRDVRKLGEVVRSIVDTKQYSINQFNNLTVQQYLDEIRRGNITIREEILGWVEISKARPSFYYKDCETDEFFGKQPIAEHYFNLDDFYFDDTVVNGSGPNDEGSDVSFSPIALSPIRNIDPNYANNMGVIGPGFQPIGITEYIRTAFFDGLIRNNNGETLEIPLLGQTNESNPIIVQLLIANKQEHFDNRNAVADPSGKYGRSRDTIINGFSTNNHLINSNTPNETILNNISNGVCLEISRKTVPPPPTVVGDGVDEDVLIDWIISDSGLGPNEDGSFDYETEDDEFVQSYPQELPDICSDLLIEVRDPMTDMIITSSMFSISKTDGSDVKNYNELPDTSGGDDQFVYYVKGKEKLEQKGVIDPRESLSEVSDVPRGVLKYIKNVENCTLDVYPNFRDKDGDVPEVVGPELTDYSEKIRAFMIDRFFTPPPLQFIGNSSDGLENYSDGNSYIELHGESAFGCGKPFAFSDIPEIFVEMYPTKVQNKGFEERPYVEDYRYIIERSTQYTGFILGLISMFGDSAPTVLSSYKHLLLNDVVSDISLGIPDMDFAEVGSPSNSSQDITLAVAGAVSTGLLKYLLSDDKSTVLKIIDSLKSSVAGALGGLALSDLLKNEEDLYNDFSNGHTRSINFFNYRFYDAFWSRNILSNVYVPNNGIIFSETVDDVNGRLNVKTEKLMIKNYVPSENEDSIWKDSNLTIEDLKKLQSSLSLPSRWKSMMRPIYQELWYDSQAIQPKNVSTTPYLGQEITKLELGDYETHRSKFGMQKNLYDIIDDAISIKIDGQTLSDANSNQNDSGFFRVMVDDSRRLLESFLSVDNLVNNDFYFEFKELSMSVSNLINIGVNFRTDQFKSYIEFVNESLKIYGIGKEVYTDGRTLLNDIIEFSKKISDATTSEQKRNELIKSFTDSALNFGKRLLQQMLSQITDFIISSGLNYLEKSLQITKPSKSSLSPRRLMKPGSVILQSKSGVYTTNKQPCPIIFLGFNDNAIMSTFSNIGSNELGCLRNLSKENKITNIDCRTIASTDNSAKSNPLFLQYLQSNLGTVSVQLNTETPTPYNYTRYSKIDTIPFINKRIRQYGRNPFLDIFYLNLLPDSSYTTEDSLSVRKMARDSRTNLSATPPPFRYPTAKNVKFSKVMNSHRPSIFPPWWNEPGVVEEYPNAKPAIQGFNLELDDPDHKKTFWKEFESWNIGDEHFRNRRRNNILRAKDRWSMSVQSIGDSNILVLRDKTPILDIYFGLMNMHIYGFSWDKILPLLNESKQAVNIKYDENGPDEETTTIDLQKLEKISERIKTLLQASSPVVINGETDWGVVSPLNEEPKPITKKIRIYNNTNYPAEILFNEIQIKGAQNTDSFGQTSDNLFYFGTIKIEKGQDSIISGPEYVGDIPFKTWKIKQEFANTSNIKGYGIIPSTTGREEFSSSGFFELDLHFVPFGTELNFKYEAVLSVPIKIKDNNGTESIVTITKNLSAICSINQYTVSEKLSKKYDVQLPYTINFGVVDNVYSYTEPVNRGNLNDGFIIPIAHHIEEDVLLKDFEIKNETIKDSNGKIVTNDFFGDNEPKLFRFSEYDIESGNRPENQENKKTVEFYELLEYINLKRKVYNKEDFLNIGPIIQIDKTSVLNNPNFPTGKLPSRMFFQADVFVNYVLRPRLNSETLVTKQEKCISYFITLD